jgi:hypothetical protein
VVGSTPHPGELFMVQAVRNLTDPVEGVLRHGSVLVCDRDGKWSRAVRKCMRAGGVRVIQTPVQAPNCNAYAERFVRSIKHECLIGSFRWANRICGTCHESTWPSYHRERNHQGLGNELLESAAPPGSSGQVHRRRRVGGILKYYHRAA